MVAAAAVEQIVNIPVGAIRPNNIRQTFDPVELEELAETIRQHGIIEPLVVLAAVDDVHELVAGERRWRAAQLAGLTEVPAVVREYSRQKAREVQIIENVQRKGLDAVEEGTGYRELIDDHGYTAEQIAGAIGKKKRYVYQRMALAASLIPAAREALARHDITANHTILLSRLPSAEMQAEALHEALEYELPVKRLDEYIKEKLLRKLGNAAFDRSDVELVAGAGACDACPKNSANAPELYPDLKAACCVDRTCYELKLQAHINREIHAANGDLVQVVRGHHHFYPEKKPKHVRDYHEYSLIEKKGDKCADQVAGIVVFGDGVGEKVTVCIHPKCNKHGAARSGGSARRPEKELAKDRAEKLELETARAVRGRVVDAMVAASPVMATMTLLEDLAEAWWADFGNEEQRLLRKRHPEWDADTVPIGSLDEAALIKLLVEFSLWRWLWVTTWHDEKGLSKDMQERAEAAGVDWAAIDAAVRAEWKDGKPKAAKAGARLADVFAGHETDDGKLILFRATAKGPVLASIELTRVEAEKKRLVEKYAGADPEELGWRVFVGVSLPKRKVGQDVMDDGEPVWMHTTPALRAAFGCIGLLVAGAAGPDAEMVRDWAARKLDALGGPLEVAAAATPLARLLKRAAGLGEPWPEPNESGAFEPQDCLRLVSTAKVGSASVWLVGTAEGWRSEASVDLDRHTAGSCPSIRNAVYQTVEAALVDGLSTVLFVCGSQPGDSKKVKAAAASVREWAHGVSEELRQVIQTPAAVEVEEAQEAVQFAPPDAPAEVIACMLRKERVAGIEFRERPGGWFVTAFVMLPTKKGEGYGLSGPLHLDGIVCAGEPIWTDREAARVAGFRWMSRFLATVEPYEGSTKATRAAADAVAAWIRKECPETDVALPGMANCSKCGAFVVAGALAAHEAQCEVVAE